MPSSWTQGRRLAFELRACPIKRKNGAGAKHRAGAEVDVFLDRCWQVGEGVRVDRAQVYLEWLQAQLSAGGATLVQGELRRFQRQRLLRRDHQEQRTSKAIERPDAVFEGILEVADPLRFGALLARGVGRHRAFGFGMLLVRPALAMLKGRLGLETARIPHADRHGLLWLGRGHLAVDSGSLRFVTAGDDDWPKGDHALPFQTISCFLMQPGTTVSHDALRLLARHGTGLLAVGEGGVRLYASMPFGPNESQRARRQATAWADERQRGKIARRMYAWRLGEVLPDSEIAVLRGIEGARMKEMYAKLAQQFGISWSGRRYDRQNPEQTDLVNQAINHAASAVEGAAMVAVAVTGTIPQLGFIHEDAGQAFCLDVADLFRDTVTLPVAFGAAKNSDRASLERSVRKLAGTTFRRQQIVAKMIDRIKEMFDADDGGSHPERGGANPRISGLMHE